MWILLLKNKTLWLVVGGVLALIITFTYGYMKGKSSVEQKAAEVKYEKVIEYIERQQEVKRKYTGNRFTDECTLSGCLPEASRGQDVCEGCLPE